MKNIKANGIMLATGAVGYAALELLWRGRTHWSMMLAGGICFFSFAKIGRKMRDLPLLYRCVAGSAVVTFTELIFGLVFNIWLKRGVWDYSRIPINFMGQICLLYSVLWGLLCVPCIPLANRLYTKLLNK